MFLDPRNVTIEGQNREKTHVGWDKPLASSGTGFQHRMDGVEIGSKDVCSFTDFGGEDVDILVAYVSDYQMG